MLSLLPPLEAGEFEEDLLDQELTPLLRELKVEITEAALLHEEGRPLLQEADGRLYRVIPFPALPPRSRLRNQVVFLVLALLIWYLIRALVA